MPWREGVMNERMRFIVRREAGEKMVDLCREFGISRKTAYKFWSRYQECGPEGLGDYSRRPLRHPNRTALEVEELIVLARDEHPTWGPKKLRVLLKREHPGVPIPVASTIGEILKREGLVRPRRRIRRCSPTPPDKLTISEKPNDVWCADFKGQFRMRNNKYCYPLTITDLKTRFIIATEALESTAMDGTYAGFVQAFRTYGLPKVIRTDNGTPFASTGLAGMSRLSVWWERLGIQPERIEPGHPEQNGQHERMHLTLKQDCTRPPGLNLLQQQEKFDDFRQLFNEKRPHEALGMMCPASLYEASSCQYPELLQAPKYPLHDRVIRVQMDGSLHLRSKCKVHLAASLAGETVGLREYESGKWLVSFLSHDLGVVDQHRRHFIPTPAEAI